MKVAIHQIIGFHTLDQQKVAIYYDLNHQKIDYNSRNLKKEK